MSAKPDGEVRAFEATIEAGARGGACVEIPFSVKEVWGTGAQVKVRATFDGFDYRGSLAPMGQGRHMLGVRKDVRAAIGKDVGDLVTVTLVRDTEPRTVQIPAELAEALDSAPDAAARYEALSFTHRREFAEWVAGGKKQETRDRRSLKAVEMLRTGKTR